MRSVDERAAGRRACRARPAALRVLVGIALQVLLASHAPSSAVHAQVEAPLEGQVADAAVTARSPSGEHIEAARRLFLEGVELADRREWDAATARFREALELHDAPSIRFNLASCLGRAGSPTSGLEQVQRLLARDDLGDLRPQVEALRRRLEAQRGSLRVRVENAPSGAAVYVDDQPLVTGEASPVDPGRHVVTLRTSEGTIRATQSIRVAPGESATVVLTWALASPEVIGSTTENRRSSSSPRRRRWAVGLAVAAVVVGAAVGLGVGFGRDRGGSQGDFSPPRLELR